MNLNKENNEVLETNDLSILLRMMDRLTGIDVNQTCYHPNGCNKEFRACTFNSTVVYGHIKTSTFVNCVFKQSQFLEVDMSKCSFEDCIFDGVDFTRVNLDRSRFRRCKFIWSKFRFCSLYNVIFSKCEFVEYVDFVKSSLISSEMRECKVPNNFAQAFGLNLSHEFLQELKSKVALTILENPSKLFMQSWHCGTAHCLAGWAVHLAGGIGYAIEAFTSPCIAGYILLPDAASHFYGTHEEALGWAKEVVKSLKPE